MSALMVELALGFFILLFGAEVTRRGMNRMDGRIGRMLHLLGGPALPMALPLGVILLQTGMGGSPDLALGALLGGSAFWLLAAMGMVFAFYPQLPALARRPLALPVVSMALLAVCLQDGLFSQPDGLLLCGLAGAGMIWRARVTPRPEPGTRQNLWGGLAYLLVGFGLLLTGSNLLIDGTIGLAHYHEVPENTLGVALLGPLGAAYMLACVRMTARAGIAHAVVGGAVTLLAGMAGLIALITPLPVAPGLAPDHSLAVLAAAVLAVAALATRRQGKVEGAVFLALYALYLVYTL